MKSVCFFVFLLYSVALEAGKVPLFLVGTGVVGSELLGQLEHHREWLKQEHDLEIELSGLANSRRMCLNSERISLVDWKAQLQETPLAFSWKTFKERLEATPGAIFVDCTSDETIAGGYLELLQKGIAVVTPNKKAASGGLEYYRALKKTPSFFHYEANVGAALPILSTIRSLSKSGDEITRIEAVLSGTLSYLFNTFDEGMSFSTLVREAQEKGYTEPDPRDDLNGMDVARKLLIIAREAGASLDLEDVDLRSFLSEACMNAKNVDAFYQELKKEDAFFTEQLQNAKQKGEKLRFIALFEGGKLSVSLKTVGSDHPFYHLSGNDNIVSISSRYYAKNPLVIQGPGAGAEVTASRVFEGIVSAGLNSK